ncbi:MAG: polysaccharide biosynthesis protein [Parcubacteria group bacterium Gr01-1014_70]|nr:MAG: polysaccharide biosynthesis protein [Parcubacteria group bacterium Gr01-1014_70]
MNLQQLFIYAAKSLERFLKTDIRYLLRGSFWLSLGSIISMAIAFILSIIYARYLSKEVYGSYRFILSTIGMAGIFSLPGMNIAIVRSAARGYDGTFRKGSRFIFFTSFGISLIAWITAFYYYARKNTPIAAGLLVAGMLIPFMEGLGNWRGYLDGKKQFRIKTVYNMAAHVFYFMCMLGAMLYIYIENLSIMISVPLLAGAYIGGRALPNLLFHWKVMRTIPKNAPEEQNALMYGLHLSASTIPSTIATYIDSILLFTFLGPAALAVYSFAIALPEQIKSFMENSATVSFSKLASHIESPEAHPEDRKRQLVQKIIRASLFSGIAVVGYILLAPFIYNVFFPRYTESVIYSQVFALSLILFPFGIFGDALKAEGNMRKIYVHSIGAPVLQIAALLALVPLYGLWGAVAGRVIGRLLNHALSYVLYRTR